MLNEQPASFTSRVDAPAADQLAEDEVGIREAGELAGAVDDILESFRGANLPPLEVVELAAYDAASSIYLGCPERFVEVTRIPADDAPNEVRVAVVFRSDLFRREVTAAAHKRLTDCGIALPASGV